MKQFELIRGISNLIVDEKDFTGETRIIINEHISSSIYLDREQIIKLVNHLLINSLELPRLIIK